MNEMLCFDIGWQRYIEDVARAEINYARMSAVVAQRSELRSRVAAALVGLAGRAQPDVTIQVKQRSESAAA